MTRGAALASQQTVGAVQQQQDLNAFAVVSAGASRAQLDAGPGPAVYSVAQRTLLQQQQQQLSSEPQHEQLEREPRRYIANHELVRTRSAGMQKEARRNPTILRKSEKNRPSSIYVLVLKQ